MKGRNTFARERAIGGISFSTSVGPAAVPVSVVRAVRDAGSARQSVAPLRIFAFWFWVVGDHPSALMSHQSVTSVKAVVALISQSRQSKQSWHVEQSLHATAPPHAPDDPDNRHTTHNGRLSRTIGHRAANNSPHRWGGRQNPTHRSSADTLHVSARSMWPALSPLVSYSIAFSTAACGHAPRRAGLGGRPRSRTRCGHARWLRWLRA